MCVFLGALIVKLFMDISETDPELASTVLGGLGGTFGLSLVMGIFSLAFATVMAVALVLRIISRARGSKSREMVANLQRIKRVIELGRSCRFPACVLAFSDFVKMGELKPHEDARDQNIRHMSDTFEQFIEFNLKNPVVFISHRACCLNFVDRHPTCYHDHPF
jgi:hypothetical protein